MHRTRKFRSNRLLVKDRAREGSILTSRFRSFFNGILFVCLIFWDWFVIQKPYQHISLSELSQSRWSNWDRDSPQVFYLACRQSPVVLLLCRGCEVLVEGVGQEGEDCEGREGLADYLNHGETWLAGTVERGREGYSQSDWSAPQSVCSSQLTRC